MTAYNQFLNLSLPLSATGTDAAANDHRPEQRPGLLSKTLTRGKGLLLLLATITGLGVSLPSFGQTTADAWKLIQTVDNVKFYYQSVSCNDNTILVLKIVNENATEVKGDWRLNIQDATGKKQFPGVLMNIKAGESMAGSCEYPGPHLMIPIALATDSQLAIEATIVR